MSETGGDGAEDAPPGPRSDRDIAAELRLRPDPPRVMRLSRRALTGLALTAGLGLGAILIVALQDTRSIETGPELVSTDRLQRAEGLSRLPRDRGGSGNLDRGGEW